ncbi:MAG: IS21-like element helper ATPase IstB [Lachnospiraceae bacterium]|nr:IS21-like element helper ATPase IstB [Lachnospiraceae bacterium]
MSTAAMTTAPQERITLEALAQTLESFGLRHASRQLAEILEDADSRNETFRDFLNDLLQREAAGRNERNRARNYAAAHFPPNPKPLEEFDAAELESGITTSQIHQLEDLNWLDSHGNIIFAGPPGLGKTMLAVGLGVLAVNQGYTVAFEGMTNFTRLLDNESTDRVSGFRMRNIRKADLVIIDEIGYTPITRAQANAFYNFVSGANGRSSIVFTTNKSIQDWAEIMGDRDLTAALLDRILSRARCFSLQGKSYRLKHPEVF